MRVILGLVALVVILALIFVPAQMGTLKGTPAPAPMRPVEAPSPLKIDVRFPTVKDRSEIEKWRGSGSGPLPRSAVVAEIRNASDRNIVLPHLSYFHPGFSFSTYSPFARNSRKMYAGGGQLDWVLLTPGKSILVYDDLADYLAFYWGGWCSVHFNFQVGYSYLRGPAEGATIATLTKSNLDAEYTGVADGELVMSTWMGR